MKADEPRQNRIPFMMSDSELEEIDDWRYANKIATRAEAIRRLCQIGLSFDRAAPAIETLVDDFDRRQRAKRDELFQMAPQKAEPAAVSFLSEMSLHYSRLHWTVDRIIRVWRAYKEAADMEQAERRAREENDRIRANIRALYGALPESAQRILDE